MAAGFKKATVNASDVPSTQTDFPAYVDLSRLGITTLAEAQSVRVYAEEAKTTEWAREIVSATEMHVKVPSLTSTVEIYVDWDGVRSDYATSATYGAEAVWSDYEAVWHMNEASGNLTDSTVNGYTMTANGSPTYAQTDPFGGSGAIDFNGTNAYFNNANGIMDLTTAFSIQCWASVDTSGLHAFLEQGESAGDGRSRTGIRSRNVSAGQANPEAFVRDNSATIALINDNAINLTAAGYRLIHAVRTTGATELELFVSGVSEATSSTNVNGTDDSNQVRIGTGAEGAPAGYMDGKIDECRMIQSALSANWITTEYNNQSDEATFWGTWTDLNATVKAIPVNAAKVAATLADYPAYVQPSAMTGWGSLTLAEAQSLRFYSDSGLTTELAREVVSADEIHVKVPSLTTSTTIYASYNGTDADYATSATYGRNAVWSDYDHVWHLGDTVDSTGNAANGTATGVTVGTGKIGEESTFSAGDIIISSGMVDTNQNSTFSLQTWAKTSAATGWFLTHQNNSNFHSQKDFGILNGDLFFLINPINSGGSQIFVEEESLTYTDNVWHLLHITYGGSNTATNVSMYKDGAGVTEVIKKNNNSNTPPTSLPVFIGSRGNAGGDFTGSLDEMRIASSELSTNWITTEYNNQSDVGTFWGTVTDAGGGGAAAKNPLFVGGGIG